MTTLTDIFNNLREENALETAPKRAVKRDTNWLEDFYSNSVSGSVVSDYESGNIEEVGV
jgi:hypothetical protein